MVTPTYKMEKILNNLSAAEINQILNLWNLHAGGSKADKILLLEAATKEKYPDACPSTFNFAEILEFMNNDQDNNEQESASGGVMNMTQMMEQFQLMLQNFASNSRERQNTPTTTTIRREQDQSEIQSAKHVTLCPFWKNDPELWFITTEQKLISYGISSRDVKLGKVIDALDPSTII